MGLAENIRKLADEGVSLGKIAVFYRVNAQSRALEEAFIRSKTPYQIVRGVEFYNRKEIRDVLAYLKVIVNPADRVALLRIINTPTRGIGKTTIDKVLDYAGRTNTALYESIKKVGASATLPESTKAKIGQFVKMMDGFHKLLPCVHFLHTGICRMVYHCPKWSIGWPTTNIQPEGKNRFGQQLRKRLRAGTRSENGCG